MKIALLTAFDSQDRRTWSGTNYFIAQSLQKYCGSVSYIGPLPHSQQELVGRIIHKGTRVLLKKNFRYYSSFLFAKKYARIANQWLSKVPVDLIVAPAGATEIALLDTTIPIMLVEDATYTLLHNYHPGFSNLIKRSFDEMQAIQRLAIKKADLLIYSSRWAAGSAIEDYGADPHKVHVVHFGANFETSPPKHLALTRKRSDRCRLLFVGVNWQYKGGDIAFETLLKLEEIGIATELIVCGCIPPETFSHKNMKVVPFLDKNDEQQYKELEKLYMGADFLLLPTRNDCTPIVCCEANAFGLPVIITHTGGIPDIVRNGENGFTLPYHARGDEYANVIASVYCDEQRYTDLVHSSRAAFDDRLNWDIWGTAVKNILAENLPGLYQIEQENPV